MINDSKNKVNSNNESNSNKSFYMLMEYLNGEEDQKIIKLQKEKIDFLQDPLEEMTIGRRIALYLMNKKWYNPHYEDCNDNSNLLKNEKSETKERVEIPSLEKAWAYFEHFTLPRYIYKPEDGDFAEQLEYAKPGEDSRRTKLYSPIHTHLNQMGDFGLAVGLYFSALKKLVVITFIAGLLNAPNIHYYASDAYSNNSQAGLKASLVGSAICTDYEYVPCPSCNETMYPADNLLATDTGLLFVKKNNCKAPPFELAMGNLATLIFILVALWRLNKLQSKALVDFDLDEQTAQDYSIQISNPPSDGHDPNEWVEFLSNKFPDAHVTVCTICVNNDVLLQSLVQRRERYNQIKRILEPNTTLDDTTLSLQAAKCKKKRQTCVYSWVISKIFHPFGLFLDIGALYDRIVVLTSEIRGLSQLENPVTNIFLSFETEQAQREILTKLSVGRLDAENNNVKAVPNEKYLFRSKHVLHCFEPEEPSTIKWENLNVKFKKQVKMIAITFFITFIIIAVMTYIIYVVAQSHESYWVTSIPIAIGNVAIPELCRILTEFEPHKSESDFMTSLYIKITFFRYVNTTIAISIITDFTLYLDDGKDSNDTLIPLVLAIFFADILTSNLLQLLDPIGHVKRHILAGREQTQAFMNMHFQGSIVTLADRYSNMSKIIFHCFYYCTLFPSSFFLCSLALCINYLVDKFSIMRTWARAAKIGKSIGKICMKYFLSLSVLTMAVLLPYYWSGYPYDNLCADGIVDGIYVGTHYVKESNYQKYYQISGYEDAYKYCQQEFYISRIIFYPPPFGDWMTEEQHKIVNIFNFAAIMILFLILVRIIWFFRRYFIELVKGNYKPQGPATNIHFSDVQGISTYIPEVDSKEFSYPLIGSCVEYVDTRLFEWKDPDNSHEFYNLVKDAKTILSSDGNNSRTLSPNVFSKVYHYPPLHKKDKLSP